MGSECAEIDQTLQDLSLSNDSIAADSNDLNDLVVQELLQTSSTLLEVLNRMGNSKYKGHV